MRVEVFFSEEDMSVFEGLNNGALSVIKTALNGGNAITLSIDDHHVGSFFPDRHRSFSYAGQLGGLYEYKRQLVLDTYDDLCAESWSWESHDGEGDD